MPDADLTALMEASAKALGLSIPEASRPAVLRDMAAILHHAEIAAQSLQDEPRPIEIAPVYRP